jgi:hypothetical protein
MGDEWWLLSLGDPEPGRVFLLEVERRAFGRFFGLLSDQLTQSESLPRGFLDD